MMPTPPIDFDQTSGLLIFPESVVAIAVTNGGEITLVRQKRPGLASDTFELPGGEIELGEDVLVAASRELMEEAGIMWTEPTLLVSLNMDFSVSKHVTHLVRGRYTSRSSVGQFSSHLYSLAELERMIASGAITHAPTVVGIQILLLEAARR
ncbi:MAG: NUDIX hydrolase [Verrucomicrobia bacterium]|nr:NUDIX hydrolase [Verrucomicrobiota bacterium]